jgi:lipoic acid synthetase
VRRLDAQTRELMQRSLGGLATVCAAANCPNVAECWQRGTATFMIMGEICTRRCRFCGVKTGKPAPLDPAEPARLARSIADLGLKYAVITCVDRDDLPDGGAAHWAACVRAVHELTPAVGIEVLAGDFQGDCQAIAAVVEAQPDVFAHNVEVVPRLQQAARPAATWQRSLAVLQQARHAAQEQGFDLLTKTGLMLGVGETDAEVREALGLIAERGIDLLTLGQYLKPLGVDGLLEVERYVPPEEFNALAEYARNLGFRGVAASPLTRSSHLAETLYARARDGS